MQIKEIQGNNKKEYQCHVGKPAVALGKVLESSFSLAVDDIAIGVCGALYSHIGILPVFS